MSDLSILPPNSTGPERALEAAITVATPDLRVISALRDADTCPESLLEHLAWELSVDDWDPAWDLSTRRNVVAASLDVHRHKGTRGAIQDALRAMGYGQAVIHEAKDDPWIGMAEPIGGDWLIGAQSHWADYWIELNTIIYQRDADRLEARLANVAPVRCRLTRAVAQISAIEIGGPWLIGDPVTIGAVYIYGSQ